MASERENAGGEANEGRVKRPPSPPRPYRRRLSNLANVKTALADVCRGIEDGTLDIQAARVLVYALSTLANVISGSDLEARIAELEAKPRGPLS